MNVTAGSTYRALMARSSLDSVPAPEALRLLGNLIDLSGELREDAGATRALDWCEALHARRLRKRERALLHYFHANAWEVKRLVTRSGWATRAWRQPELESQIIHLRHAVNLSAGRVLSAARQASILTNLGNVFSHVGRLVEAIAYWDRAVQVNPKSGMARANRGYGLLQYSRFVHERHQAHVLVNHGIRDLRAGLSLRVEAHAYETFRGLLENIEKRAPKGWQMPLKDAPESQLGNSTAERIYRRWCLDQRLVLNPINDVGVLNQGATDGLTLPGIVRPIQSPLTDHGLFNQLKQEFAAARYLLYEGLTSDQPHFADKGVRLVDTFDWPAYSLNLEKTKVSYRMAYSLFDKIAFWINHYYNLGIPEHRISFKGVWYMPKDKSGKLRPELDKSYNYPLQGLFWLQKDLYEKDVRFTEPIEPESRQLSEIRNHLEHKYLKLHVELRRPEGVAKAAASHAIDPLCYSLARVDFERKTLNILRLARAALVYLCQSTYIEEGHRATLNPSAKVAEMGAFEYHDDLKI